VRQARGKLWVAVVSATALILVVTAGLAFAGSAGKLDRSFGDRGHVVVSNANGYAGSLAIGRHGRIVVAGTAENALNVARLRPNGEPDHFFGNRGVTQLVEPGVVQPYANAVAVSRKGGVIVAGTVCATERTCDITVARLTPNGEPKLSFGHGGQAEIDFPDRRDIASSVAIVRGGRILVAGSTCRPVGGDCHIALARLQPNGELDGSFGDGGQVVSFFGHCTVTGLKGDIRSMAVDSRGRIVVGGACEQRAPVALARFKPNGDLDHSFGNRGRVNKDAGIRAADALAVDSRDRVYAAGNAGGPALGVARLGIKGKIDRSFGRHGTAIAKFRFDRRIGPVPHSVGIDSNRHVVVTGSSGRSGFVFARFKRSGRVDRGFGDDGHLITGRARGFRDEAAGAIDSRNRIVGAGSTGSGSDRRFVLMRVLG
jgi:uncharacterized delta-60 repeat protein